MKKQKPASTKMLNEIWKKAQLNKMKTAVINGVEYYVPDKVRPGPLGSTEPYVDVQDIKKNEP